MLRDLLARLDRPYVVLGNHDVALTRDPFSAAAELHDLRTTAELLEDEAAVVAVRGRRVQLVGVDPRSYRRPPRRARAACGRRKPTCACSSATSRLSGALPDGAFHLVLAGHLHAGQLVLPFPGGQRRSLTRTRVRSPASTAAAARCCTCLPGLGTTLVPFRFCARPEVTELVLRSA